MSGSAPESATGPGAQSRQVRTDRLVLRPPEPGDQALWIRLHRDPTLYRHAPHAMPATDAQALDRFTETLNRWRTGEDYRVVCDLVDGTPLGIAGVRRRLAQDPLPPAAAVPGAGDEDAWNLYYRLSPEAHGRGLAREAARAVLAHAFEWLPSPRVVALARAVNVASIRVATAAGLDPVGELLDGPDRGTSIRFRAPRVELIGRAGLTDRRRAHVLDLWCATNDAGGAVGFLPGAPRDAVAKALVEHERQLAAGLATMVLLTGVEDTVIGLGVLARSTNPLLAHRRAAYRVMTDPARRGRNLGRILMAALHRQARAEHVEVITVSVRSGHGTEAFYQRCGYREIGRLAGGIRLAPGDDRDDVMMAAWLAGRLPVED